MHQPILVSRPRFAAAAGVLLAVAGLTQSAFSQVSSEPKAPVPQKPAPEAPPPPPPPAAEQPLPDGPSFEISTFLLRYATEQPDRPALEEFSDLQVPLGIDNGVFVAQRPGVQSVTLSLDDLTSPQRGGRRFSVSAINSVGASIVKELNRRGVIGVLVVPAADQIDQQTLADLRAPGNTTLTLDVWTRAVTQVRTLGSGERWSKPEASGDKPSIQSRIDNKVHDRIRDNSPLQPGPNGQPGDLLRKDVLDDYLYRLNRHPGRRVDAAIASGENPGDVVLDYLVTENRPWTVYAQISNTGTEQTNEWRERFGIVHNQLTNRDDILSLEYVTAGFDETNAIIGSYDAPFGGSDKLRFKVYGSASEYTAADVGLAGEDFTGQSWYFGGELSLNVWQRKFSFIDIFGGIRYDHEKTENEAILTTGETDFLIPYIGARYDRTNDKSSTHIEGRFETNLPDLAGTDQSEVDNLGRADADKDWTVFRFEAATSFFLEPLLYRRDWGNPDAPYRHTTLAHEIALSLRAQYGFDNRLIPQQEITAGGLYTVRGYDESIVAGDNAIIASAEYRWHIPRGMAMREPGTLMGKPFRYAPDQRYGRPDWDLVAKGFIDAARVTSNQAQESEPDEDLVGIGVGFDLVYKRNFTVRVDFGVPLLDAGPDSAGSGRVHVVGTILY